MTAVLLLAPQIPLLFMGEEWGATQPFCFFTDFHDELADAVREGRRREFRKFPQFADEAARAHIPDPNAPSTFAASRLDWSVLEQPEHAAWLDLVRRLLRIRSEAIVPRLAGIGGHAGDAAIMGETALRATWTLGDGSRLQLIANLGDPVVDVGSMAVDGKTLYASHPDLPDELRRGRLPPWSVLWLSLGRAMSARAKLRRLGQLYGIESGYTDFWGRRRRVSAATERALLEAMGIAAGSEREIAASLREAAARPWRRLLAPVRVLAPPSDPLEVTFSLPRSHAGARVRWSLVEEAGGVHEGEAAIDDLPTVAEAEVEGERYRRWRLRLPHELPLGYHQLQLAVGGAAGETVGGSSGLIVAPPRCFLPEEEPDGGRRLWGLACQLYGLRSERNWGMGDFTDLARLAEQAAGLGAAAIGINPLHALFPADPGHISPYSPSSRLFLNVLYIDPEAVPELVESPEAQAMLADDGFQAALGTARGAEFVDYPAVARLKLPVLEHLYAAFRQRHLASPDSARGHAFRAFVNEMGEPLERHVVFDALHEHAIRNFGAWAWQHWPEPYRRPGSPEVAAFAAEQRGRVEFFAYLQWLADGQLADAQARARAAGMQIGLYQDLAVAVNPASSVAWAHPGVSLSEVSAGAPPDWFNPNGQNWVLSPLSPLGLRESCYGVFIEALRHNMRHAGAVRIDHVMGLKRLFWIPAGASAAVGAYVRYPFDDLVRIVALESRRHRCLVIGEDLGTVPRGFRPAMQQAGLMSCRVFYFERDRKGAFLRARELSRACPGVCLDP